MTKRVPLLALLLLPPTSASAESDIVMTPRVPHELVAWVEAKSHCHTFGSHPRFL